MLEVGKSDVFERNYTQKFRVRVGRHGEFVEYERDRAARDIGLHLTQKRKDGREVLSASLCWFQLKGVMQSTLSREVADGMEEFTISLKVSHLAFWYLQPMPTYLVLYIESLDEFFVVNIQKYVEDEWGRAIVLDQQETRSIRVSKSSRLDDHAFELVLCENERSQWVKALDAPLDDIQFCQRDSDLIWKLGTAEKRQVRHRILIKDWQSKTRGEVHFEEIDLGDGDTRRWIRGHWHFMLSAERVEDVYPYIRMSQEADEESGDWEDDGEDYFFELLDGRRIHGEDAAGEYIEYEAHVGLNELGLRLFKTVESLESAGLVEIDPDNASQVWIAPWNARSV